MMVEAYDAILCLPLYAAAVLYCLLACCCCLLNAIDIFFLFIFPKRSCSRNSALCKPLVGDFHHSEQ
jgi:hypothetical protein